ncbi:MAG: xanthine dehydrogenase small subunit, partial [Hyphomicrobiaceae bacterium]|nr:xanthine dehydrogenase small subunit [Hyphomicrobiaceae bacterium]
MGTLVDGPWLDATLVNAAVMRESIQFLLNGRLETLRNLPPATTLLNYLRKAKRLTGTKEGCAEGDCGACTVVVGELNAGRVRYRAVNACILLVGMLEGRSVTTVEHLRGADGRLHPVQQALVAAHASQCGFCTPGFVMSLYALYLGDPGETRPRAARINDMLAGNLCRCTGYGPIVRAAQSVYDLPAPDGGVAESCELRGLQAIAHRETVLLECGGRRFYSPASLEDFARLYAQNPGATIVSGATDVGVWITKARRDPASLIWTGRVSDLKAVTEDGALLRIGAAATWSDVELAIGQHFPDFGEVVRRFGSVQVRNTATIGGNIANGSPVGDGAPALIALDARLVLRKHMSQRTLPLEAFFIAYGKQDRQPAEFVEAIEVPLLARPERLKCYKLTKRFDQDVSAVCGAFNIEVVEERVREARICYGGMAATPKRASNVEAALKDQAWTLATVMRALPAFDHDY